MLSGFHLQQGNPARIIDRIAERYARLTLADPDIVDDSELFNLAMIYATALHMSGEELRLHFTIAVQALPET